MTSPREITFKTAYWYYEQMKDNSSAIIHIGGRTGDNKTVHVIVENYHPAIYLQLSDKIQWTDGDVRATFKYLRDKMRVIDYEPQEKFLLRHKTIVKTLKLSVATQKDAGYVASQFNNKDREFVIPNVCTVHPDQCQFSVHENNRDSIIKFTANK